MRHKLNKLLEQEQNQVKIKHNDMSQNGMVQGCTLILDWPESFLRQSQVAGIGEFVVAVEQTLDPCIVGRDTVQGPVGVDSQVAPAKLMEMVIIRKLRSK